MSIACLVLDFVTKKYYTVSELQKIYKEREEKKKHVKEIAKKENKNNNKKK